ncbi:crossover junction endodeoxyribonuclease RuvC [Candidatus Cytomitobacter primus]|uniref:crossover junction endodeoxyribonuclease n=1 Tax=Candidatus Cytomitobacter primus TaxID=2066024 RepID=A0A5C0UHB9_9PROT|nr:crossover junction endodeoxyribonuclease RuvC [Candidatus Cytomitobacter primus]QEK38712.1 hypothetical protein FZC34_02225 [Candidatus Cytomitobacter primus]
MKILGLDAGLCKTGWGVIKRQKSKMKCIDYGLIKPNAKLSLEERLAFLWTNMMNILQTHSPDHVAIEKTFFGLRNPSSGVMLGAAYGTIISTAGLIKTPVFSYATKMIKRQVAEKGDASKEEIALSVCSLFKIDAINQEDITDALAAALCHEKLYKPEESV